MNPFSSRALGTAARSMRAATAFSANDLVQRTLAIHGLVPQATPDLAAEPAAKPKRNAKPAAAGKQPKGALFQEDTHSCAAGSRRYLSYLPASRTEGVQGMIVLLHGCTQTPEDFATGTAMNALAEEHRLIIVYPHQSRGENAQSCWNWFRRGDQRRGMGEPAILADLATSLAAQHAVPKGRSFAAGLSAGGAMAVILGETYPEVFTAIGVHSGLPAGSAKDVSSAFAAMAGNAPPRSIAPGPVVRTIVFHGTADATVHPINSTRIVQDVLAQAPRETVQSDEKGLANGRAYTRTTTLDPKGVVLAEQFEVENLGHAWSGGSAAGSYTDAKGPDASAEMVRFFLADTPTG